MMIIMNIMIIMLTIIIIITSLTRWVDGASEKVSRPEIITTTTTTTDHDHDPSFLLLKSWTLYHLIGNYNNNNNNNNINSKTEFTARNTILMKFKTNQEEIASNHEDDRIELTIEPIIIGHDDDSDDRYNSTIVTNDMKAMLYHHHHSGIYYQLKVVDNDNDNNDPHVVYASVPACDILRASYRDEMILTNIIMTHHHWIQK
jgi:hypothetical protein